MIHLVLKIQMVIEFLGKYYGDYAYDFTVHAHLHLADQVEKHGPLKTHSQFVFEVLWFNFKYLNMH